MIGGRPKLHRLLIGPDGHSNRPQQFRADDVFFPAMALIIPGVVVYGFAQSYFLAGILRAPLPNKLVHLHAGLFVPWIFLLLLQNVLVALRKVRWHRTQGLLGVILPPLMLIFGMLTVFDSISCKRSLLSCRPAGACWTGAMPLRTNGS